MCAFCTCRTLSSLSSRTQSFSRPGGCTQCHSLIVHFHWCCVSLLIPCCLCPQAGKGGGGGRGGAQWRTRPHPQNRATGQQSLCLEVLSLGCVCVMWLSKHLWLRVSLCSLVPLRKTKAPWKRYSAVVVVAPPNALPHCSTSMALP